MTLDQGLAFGIIGAVIALLIWDKLRYDLVAMLALLAAVAAGIVKPEDAFSGFSDDIVIIVGSALVVSAAVGRSGIIEEAMRPLSARMKTVPAQIVVLTGAVTLLSAVVKNIGALAIFMPIAVQVARRNGTKVSSLLMPMAFGSLLGGLMTLVGTSPNIIVSRVRSEIMGEPFGMFDFTPVGLTVSVAGLAFLAFGWRLLPGRTVADLEEAGEGDVTVAAIIRENHRRYIPSGHWELYADDILVLECDTQALARIVQAAGLQLVAERELEGVESADELRLVEAVVSQRSLLIGQTVEDVCLRERYGVNLMALSRRGRPIRQRLRRIRFQFGDLVALQMRAADVPETLGTLGCLPLAERDLALGRPQKQRLAVLILGVTVALVATGVAPVAPAFFGAAVAMALFRVLSLKEAYDAIEWPILVLLGALIPVSEALRKRVEDAVRATGYRPNPLVTKGKHIHVIGDASKVGNLRTVIWQAWDVCMKL